MSRLYLITEGFGPTVIESQVVDLLASLEARGERMDLLSMPDVRDLARHAASYFARQTAYRGRLRGRVGTRPGLRVGLRGYSEAHIPMIASFCPGVLRGPGVVHARAHRAAIAACALRAVNPALRVIYDVRGDSVAELEVFREGQSDASLRRHRGWTEDMLRRAATGADAVLTVSDELRKLVIARDGAPADRCHVVPCLANNEYFFFDAARRRQQRAREGLESHRVLLFPGSTGRWHYLEPTLRLVRAAMELDPTVVFVALTPDRPTMRSACAQALPADRFIVKTVPHEQMPDWLNAADAGLLLRQPHPINRVASPTKFAEYALTGLPVWMTDGIGDHSEYAQSSGLGIIVDAIHPEAQAAEALQFLDSTGAAWRTEQAARARPRLGKSAYLGWLAELYRRLEAQDD